MSRLARLREERARLVAECTSLNDKYGNKPMPKPEADRLDTLLGAVEAIDRDIEAEGANAAASARPPATWSIDGSTVPVLRGSADIRRYYSRLPGVAASAPKVSLADFVRGVAGMPTTDAVRASLSEGTDTAGGYLVPSMVMPGVLEALVPASSVLSAGAGIIPVAVGAKSFTQAAIDNIPTAAWRAENGNVAESDPTFRAAVATPRSLAFFFKVSRELLADATNLEQALTIAVAQAFAKELDRAALRGSGTAPEPRGVLNSTSLGVNAVANGANGASLATTKFANLLSAYQLILEDNAPAPTAAIMSPRSRVVLGGLADSTGQPLQTPAMLEPVALLSTTQVPNDLSVGSSADCSEIYLGDFTNMAFMMREQLSIQKVDQLFATTGQMGFVCHARCDVMLQYPKAFAVVTGVRP